MIHRAAFILILAGALPSFAEPAKKPDKPEVVVDVVGEPRSISAEPASVRLAGPRFPRQVLVTGVYAADALRDLTRVAKYRSLDESIATVTSGGLVHAKGNGSTKIEITVADKKTQIDVVVQDFDKPSPVNFHQEAIAAFTRARCNSGARHGTPSGKKGFRLSLLGYLPDQDFETLTREFYGRRTNPLLPKESLILQKGTGAIHHEGGKKLFEDQEAYRVLHDWIKQGCQPSPKETPEVAKLEILPRHRVLLNESRMQQVVVIAHFADGSQRDVTPLVSFSTSDEQLASVAVDGLVTFHRKGSVAILCHYLQSVDNAKLTYVKQVDGFEWKTPPINNYVDEHVFQRLKELQISPSELCSDEEFIRRLSLDLIGTLPTPDEVRAFLDDKDAKKRDALIDRLLERPEYADFWAMKWGDVLRASRKKTSYRGAHNYRRYLVKQFADNRRFDQFVAELITGEGDTLSNPPANYYRIARDPEDCAETTGQLFMGVRMQCAKCHNPPFERWTQDDYYGFAAFFARVGRKQPTKESEKETIFVARSGEVKHQRTQVVMKPKAPGVDAYDVAADEDRRTYLAKWLTDPKNPFLARSIVNRTWYHLLHKGIVDPPDDFRDSNPACNEPLLEALAADFVKSGFDYQHVIRTIVRSRTYQLSAEPNKYNLDDERYFSRAYPKLMGAEQMLDAICQVTEIPGKFKDLPLGTRAIQLPDTEIGHPFLQAFGQPTREMACECGRESESTLNQALNLINGDVVHGKLRAEKNRIGRLVDAKKTDREIVEEFYLSTHARRPRDAEYKLAEQHLAGETDRRKALEDYFWALLNSKHFLFRH